MSKDLDLLQKFFTIHDIIDILPLLGSNDYKTAIANRKKTIKF
ncbi:hypothetical protein [Okeania sp. SIO3I5]|nr:hypothetical protein [Okeania sp. SIO3I5]